MNTETKGNVGLALGAAVAMAICCGGPLVFGFLASGSLQAVAGAFLTTLGLPILGAGAILVLFGVALLLVRRPRAASERADATCCADTRRHASPDELPVSAEEARR